jgi:hypothetical protein
MLKIGIVGTVTIKCVAVYQKILVSNEKCFTFHVTGSFDEVETLALNMYNNILKSKNLDKEDYRLALYQ